MPHWEEMFSSLSDFISTKQLAHGATVDSIRCPCNANPCNCVARYLRKLHLLSPPLHFQCCICKECTYWIPNYLCIVCCDEPLMAFFEQYDAIGVALLKTLLTKC